jgi:hypothetical protein
MNTDAQVLYLSIETLVRAQHQTFLTNVINQLHLLTIFVSLLPDGSFRSSLLELRSHLTTVLTFLSGDDRHPEFDQDIPFICTSQPAHPGET